MYTVKQLQVLVPLKCHKADDHRTAARCSAITLEVGHYAFGSGREKFLFWCPDKASRYMEVGRVRVKSGWHWVEENSVTCLCSQRTTYLLIRVRHRTGKAGARGIIVGEGGLG